MRVRFRDAIMSYLYRVGGEGRGGVKGPRTPPSVSAGAERRPREKARRRTTAHPARAERRSLPFMSFDSRILLALWGLSGSKVGEALLVISVWGRVMHVEAHDAAGSYCPPQSSPRLVFPGVGSTETFSCGAVGLEGSGSFEIIFGLEFFGLLVISLVISLGWRKAVSRIAAPGGLVLGHRRSPTEGVVPGPSGDA